MREERKDPPLNRYLIMASASGLWFLFNYSTYFHSFSLYYRLFWVFKATLSQRIFAYLLRSKGARCFFFCFCFFGGGEIRAILDGFWRKPHIYWYNTIFGAPVICCKWKIISIVSYIKIILFSRIHERKLKRLIQSSRKNIALLP